MIYIKEIALILAWPVMIYVAYIICKKAISYFELQSKIENEEMI